MSNRREGVEEGKKKPDNLCTSAVVQCKDTEDDPKHQGIGPEFESIYSRAHLAKSEIDTIADQIAGKYGGTVSKAPLKSRERALQKIENDYGGDPAKIKDLARNTIILPEDEIPDAVMDLEKRGAKVKVIDGTKDPLGYSGVNSTIETRSGVVGEIQVNSPEMIYAKESEANARNLLGDAKYDEISTRTGQPGGKGHLMYEEYRILADDDPRRTSLERQSRNYYNSIRN